MAHLSLYRKHRSQSFAELIGQEHVVRTLRNALAAGKMSHAYLFTGPRGTGKTSTARLLAKALCCEKGPTADPCNECEACVSITEGSCMDVREMDAASESGVDDVRDSIVEGVEYQPSFCRYRVFIVDEVHDLSPKAFDALLKTLEEPPAHVVFILATTEYHKVPPTIRSRCQKYEFHRATVQELVVCLERVVKAEGVEVEPAALSAIARIADGGYRDALTLLEQALLVSDGPLSVETVYDQLGLIPDETADQILLATEAGDAKAVMSLLEEAIRRGRDPRAIIESLLQRVADLTRSAYGVDALEDATRGAALHETAARIGRDRLLFLRSHLAEVHRDVRDVSLPRVWMESALLQLTQSQSRPAGAAAERPDEVLKRAEPAPKATEAAGNGTKPAEKTPAARPSPPRPSGDPKLDESRAVWTKMLEAISGGERPPAIALRLQQSEVVAVKGPELTVELRGQFHVDWMRDNLQRQGFVVKELKAVSGNDYKVVYRASARAAVDAEPEAVELPAEGPRLEKLAREILGSA